MRLIGAIAGALVVVAIEEYLELYDRLTGKDRKFIQFQAEQRARLGNYFD
jgi:ABC-type branched-subunit amino acid transport system permease subunit